MFKGFIKMTDFSKKSPTSKYKKPSPEEVLERLNKALGVLILKNSSLSFNEKVNKIINIVDSQLFTDDVKFKLDVIESKKRNRLASRESIESQKKIAIMGVIRDYNKKFTTKLTSKPLKYSPDELDKALGIMISKQPKSVTTDDRIEKIFKETDIPGIKKMLSKAIPKDSSEWDKTRITLTVIKKLRNTNYK